MRRIFLHIPAVLAALLLCFACSDDKSKVIPRGKMAKIYAEMLMMDQWAMSDSRLRQEADTSLIYEPIFEKYGYDGEDYRQSVTYYMEDPERFSRIFRATSELLDARMEELMEQQKKMLKKAGKGYAEVLSAESARSLSFAEAALQVKKNREWLEYSNGIIEELAAIQDFYRSAALIEGVTHGIMGEVMQIRTLMATGEEKYAVAQLRERLRNIASEQNCNNVIAFIDSEIEKYRNGNGGIVEELGLLRQRTELICGNVEAMKELLCDIKKACDRISMLSSIERIASFVDTFYNCMMECKEIENALEDIPEYELGKLKALREKRETFREMSARVLKSLEKEYSFFYTPVNERGVDSELFSLLGLSVSNCRNCSNNAKILLLLLSGRKIENNHIHILIGIPHREENMRKERWTVEQNIRKNIAKVIAYAHECPLSCASLVVDCCTAEK